jgi:MarR family 2-MHQ and catechol resistance regulon transcriptional repressor
VPEPQGNANMILDERIMVFVVTASEIFKKKSSAIFKRYGLTFSQYSVLKYLIACEEGRDTVGNVSKRMLVTGANVTGLAKRMERCGLIERKNDSRDERLTMLHITPFGLQALSSIREVQERHVSEYLEAYSGEQKQEILSALQGIVRKGKVLAVSNY